MFEVVVLLQYKLGTMKTTSSQTSLDSSWNAHVSTQLWRVKAQNKYKISIIIYNGCVRPILAFLFYKN